MPDATGVDAPQDLSPLQQAINRGDTVAIRQALVELDEQGHEQLRQELGDAQYDMVFNLVRRATRGSKRGRVILLHGIMGSTLAATRRRRTNTVWVNYWRLFNGRVADLELDAEGGPVDKAVSIGVLGQHRKYYLPMLLRLDQNWDVRPFAYDWRADISASAAALAELVKSFARGEPVHLVAHSMGGLVSRQLMHQFPQLWAAMADADKLRRGGRLVMLGTPNHGSYAIPMVLAGEEKNVRMLSRIDRKHSQRAIQKILNTFPGSYQMLPSPLIENGDDHRQLFDRKAWGAQPVDKALLGHAARFHDALKGTVDGSRQLYVAGYARDTPYRIRIDNPGKFRYQITKDGDGRVPHELGLLDGVPTYWADATHGDLPRNADIMDSIDDLLETGKTTRLPTVKPVTRAPRDPEWHSGKEFERIDPEVDVLLGAGTRAADGRSGKLSSDDRLRIEQALVEDYLGTALTSVRRTDAAESGRAKRSAPRLEVEVVWGDITACDGQVYMVGHYHGVLPQVAEQALDAAMADDRDKKHLDRHVLRQHTLRGTLRGALGDVDFFPWHHESGETRTVAVGGMGYIGNFTPGALRILTRRMAWAVAGLRGVDTVCTVLIGSGEGTLTVEEALDGLVLGMGDALTSDLAQVQSRIKKVRIVELYRDRAEHIHRYLHRNRENFKTYLDIKMSDEPVRGDAARIRTEDGLWLMLDGILSASQSRSEKRREACNELLRYAARRSKVSTAELRDVLDGALERNKHTDARPNFYVSQKPEEGDDRIPFRLSFLTDGDDIRAAAITDTATVSERVIRLNRTVIDKVCAEVLDPDARMSAQTPEFMRKLVIPHEFRDVIDRGEAVVFEVDRAMAEVPWEIVLSGSATDRREPLAIRAQVSRQLRTAYSAGPGRGDRRGGVLRALVIGDPGSPAEGDNLPGARAESRAVYEVLKRCGVETQFLVGSEDVSRSGWRRGLPPATLAAVLEKLMLERFDILHYTGHGDFDPDNPTRAGWLFADGLLTAYDLEAVSEVPSLIFANACLSGRTSRRASGRAVTRARDDLILLPSLADEFFRRGVMNYVGTAWEVSDEGAVLFAEQFYKTLLGDSRKQEANSAGATIGAAVYKARRCLWDKRQSFGKLWAAYQHYGDPTSSVAAARQPGEDQP